jgi:endonuclease/exonuclease/phosphatase family metal-dependent hydrolase
MLVSVTDRDVILARSDVDASAVSLPCAKPAPSSDGCHYQAVATVPLPDPLPPITVERGFVAVNAKVEDDDYLFVNTHLEVRMLGDSQASTALQPYQAMELAGTLAGYLYYHPAPPRVILAGDFNSAPSDDRLNNFATPYEQLSAAFTDMWNLRPGNPDGFTCCEAADLLNDPSTHDRRIDVVFADPAPTEVKANVMDAKSDDKTISGQWPSDHASVIAELTYD